MEEAAHNLERQWEAAFEALSEPPDVNVFPLLNLVAESEHTSAPSARRKARIEAMRAEIDAAEKEKADKEKEERDKAAAANGTTANGGLKVSSAVAGSNLKPSPSGQALPGASSLEQKKSGGGFLASLGLGGKKKEA